MKKVLFSLLVSIMLLGVTVGKCMATPPPPPPIEVRLNMDPVFLLNNDPVPDEDIIMVITLENTGTDDIITSDGFGDADDDKEKDFHLFFAFTDPDGNQILANNAEGSDDPEPPRSVPVFDGSKFNMKQVDLIETVPFGWILQVTVPDAHAFYNLTRAGTYSVKAIIPIRTYANKLESNPDYAKLHPALFEGVIESDPVSFSLLADADGDGFLSDVDCDDNDASVNPGVIKEITEDGKDNDCNPATLDGAVTVYIDIKPGSFPNSINLGSKGTVPVAILSNGTFDATEVDPASITLAGATVKIKGKGTNYMASEEDVNGDNLVDLVVHVLTEAFELSEGDTVAVLEGRKTAGALPTEFHIRGEDFVRVVPE